jgi:DNA-binding transcriptional MocR family regulator
MTSAEDDGDLTSRLIHDTNEAYANISLGAITEASHAEPMLQRHQKPFVPSERAQSLPGSPIRELLSSARSLSRLDLGGGIPDPMLFPDQDLARVAVCLLGERSAQALQYAPTEGLLPLRTWIARQLERRGYSVRVDQILVTHGSQQALFTVAALLTSPRQTVALEQPVYPGALQAFVLAQAPVVPLPVTREGWQLEALHARDLAAIYVIPNHQNPTGRKARLEQCLLLAQYAEATGTFVIEDDAYGELDFDGQTTRPLVADAPTRGILLGTFSKTLCPGLRVGWIVAPEQLVPPLVRILQASSLQPGTLAQHLAHDLLETMDWPAHLTRLRSTYAERASLLRARCESLGLRSDPPRGGFFLWVRASGTASLLAKGAAATGVLTVPERAFRHPSHPGADQHLRLAFTRFLDAPGDSQRLTRALRPAELV